MNRFASIFAFLLVFVFMPLNSFSNTIENTAVQFADLSFDNDAEGVLNNTNPCPPAVVVFTDTTFTLDQNGILVYTVYFTINGVAYWCTYNPSTGQTTTNLPSYQGITGFGPYANASLVYSFSSGPGCRGVEDTLYFQVPPGTSHCNGSGNAGGSGGGNNGNGTGTNGNGSGNNGNGTGTNGNGTGNVGGVATDSAIKSGGKMGTDINVYPNPATYYIRLDIDATESSEVVNFILMDKSGTVKINEVVKDPLQRIDVSDLDKGDYFYRIISQNEVLGFGTIFLK